MNYVFLLIFFAVLQQTLQVLAESIYFYKSQQLTNSRNIGLTFSVKSHTALPVPRRTRRKIFGEDNRITIHPRMAETIFPFSTTVRLASNCSGVLVSGRHVLTTAHCVAPLVNGSVRKKRFKVGFLMAEAKFAWAAVKRVWIPNEWMKQSSPPWKHDYALVVLRKRHKRRFITPYAWNQNLAILRYFIHFSDFDFASYPVQLKYRFCVVLNDTGDVLHSRCDTTDMGSGAGVYIRPYDPRSRTWWRYLIGIQTRDCIDCSQGESYTVIRKITPRIREQLCQWTKRTRYKLC